MVIYGAPQSTGATVGYEHHRLRRNALNGFFSKLTVTQLEPLIVEKIEKLGARFARAAKTGEVLRMDVVYKALTVRIV